MPPRVLSHAALVHAVSGGKPQETEKKETVRQAELRRAYQRLTALMIFLKENPCGDLIVLPLPRNLTNSSTREHWALTEAHDQYFDHCDIVLGQGLIPKPPKEAPAKIKLEATLYVTQEMDEDNASGRMKWPTDWLVKRGYVANDTKKNIVREKYPDQVVVKADLQRIELKITPLEG